MKYKFVIQNGKVEEKDNTLIFKGGKVESTNPITNETKAFPLYSAILIPEELKGGSISCDIELSDVGPLTRCGFILNNTFIDGTTKYYQAGLRNQAGFCGLDYYNGNSWVFLTQCGSDSTIEKGKKYSLSFRIKGNVVAFSINDVPMYVYTKLKSTNGVCGIFTYNEADSVVSNVCIQSEKPTAFSVMKFEKDFDELYHDVIAPVCEKHGYKTIRGDECYTTSSVLEDIVREISNASLIIADITMDNPNVFYELGYAHALSKPTILLADTNKRDRLPFDISGYRTIFYENTIGGKKEIEKMLHKFIENIHENT